MVLKTSLITAITSTLFVTIAASAAAEGQRPGGGEPPRTREEAAEHALERFERADENGDGFLARDELPTEGRRARFAEWMFEQQDTNQDGFVSQSEATIHATERFDSIDTDGDGALSDEELQAMRDKIRSERRQRRG
ncbi:MAG: hypothetical protein AAGG79_06725 [Pseudomonadota bacterium]